MNAIVIQSQSESNLKLLSELARKLGEKVTSLDDEQIEEFALGNLMKKVRTGKNVKRETVMRKLSSK